MRLSILSRLILGYSVLLVLVAGMSVYAIVQLGRVNDVTHSIILTDNTLISLNKELTDDLLSETRYEKKYLIVRDRAFYDGFLKSKEEFGKKLAESIRLDVSGEVRASLMSIADLHQTYVYLFTQEAEYLREGQSYAKALYDAEKEQMVGAALDELSKVRALGQQAIVDKVRKLSEAGTEARTVAITVSTLSLVFGLLLAVLITRSITKPLRIMQKKTKDIADGVFEADLKLPSPPEIGELAQAFNTMCRNLKVVDRMKSDFFSLMSHELRTPLTSIKEGTNLFLEGRGGDVTEKQKRLLTIISEESNRLIELVNSVLDLSKLESGMLTFTLARADLSPLIARVVQEVGPLAESKQISLVSEVGRLVDVSMDSERILQVLRNLVGNALKFTPRGGTVRIAARHDESTVIVSVSDTGPGIPQEHAEAIFDKFRQVPGAGRIHGTGLGLAIVKHIIQTHGGRVWVLSEPGNGSTFLFQLPV